MNHVRNDHEWIVSALSDRLLRSIQIISTQSCGNADHVRCRHCSEGRRGCSGMRVNDDPVPTPRSCPFSDEICPSLRVQGQINQIWATGNKEAYSGSVR